MKKVIFSIALIGLSFSPLLSYAQSELGRDRSIKNTSEARSIGFTNTMMPVATGLGSVLLFEDPTVQRVGSALAMYGLIVGPSSANFYAQDYARGMIGILARIGAGLVLKDATNEIFGNEVSDALGWDNKDVSLSDTNILIGAGIFAGSMVYNIIAAKNSVESYNNSKGFSVEADTEIQQGKVIPMLGGKVRF